METKKIGWYVLLFGIVMAVVVYFGWLDQLYKYVSGNQLEPLTFTQWLLTPIAWSILALIIVGAIMIRFGRRGPVMPDYTGNKFLNI